VRCEKIGRACSSGTSVQFSIATRSQAERFTAPT
jgi:hypothetical protein